MKNISVKFWLTFAAALGLGVLLHFAYGLYPNSLVSLFSPIRESLWEHVKLLYYPLLLAGLFLGGRQGRGAWMLSLVLVCALTLLAGWAYHVVFQGASLAFDLALYFVMMLLGFLLPRVLWPLTRWPGVGKAALALVCLLGALLVGFTLAPPEGVLFADLSAVRTFYTIPV